MNPFDSFIPATKTRDPAPSYEALAARFRPIFARIAEGAVERERTRTLPYEQIDWLRKAGFGAVRIPIGEGGSGATLPQLFRLLVELGEADSNLVQILRAHLAFCRASASTTRTWSSGPCGSDASSAAI